jgi:23S rRNA (guanosine2251-2'-O)-methyltransferase
MAGNSQRRGAVRKASTKKGPTEGTGGNGRQALEGRGATPRAEDRTWHPAHKRKVARERLDEKRSKAAPRRKQNFAGDRVNEVVAGRNSVLEALRAEMPVSKVFLATRIEHDDRTKEILAIATERGLPLFESSKIELDRMTDGSIHQGVAIAVPPYEYYELEDLLDAAENAGQAPLIVALDSVTDPRNLGAVLRSAGAFGAHGVLVPERRAAGVTASAWKVSAGAAARVPVARETNLVRSLETLKKAGCFVIGLDGGGDVSVGSIPFATDPLVIVLGSEGKGLSRLVRETCDSIVSIPMSSVVESLNAGVAASITLYEVAKARTEQA